MKDERYFHDEEDSGYITDPNFWSMIQDRRREKDAGIPLQMLADQVDREIAELETQKTGVKPKTTRKKKNR